VPDGQRMALAAGERRQLAKQSRQRGGRGGICRWRRIEGSDYQLLGQCSIRVEFSLL
jgi:hypothetical protein